MAQNIEWKKRSHIDEATTMLQEGYGRAFFEREKTFGLERTKDKDKARRVEWSYEEKYIDGQPTGETRNPDIRIVEGNPRYIGIVGEKELDVDIRFLTEERFDNAAGAAISLGKSPNSNLEYFLIITKYQGDLSSYLFTYVECDGKKVYGYGEVTKLTVQEHGVVEYEILFRAYRKLDKKIISKNQVEVGYKISVLGGVKNPVKWISKESTEYIEIRYEEKRDSKVQTGEDFTIPGQRGEIRHTWEERWDNGKPTGEKRNERSEKVKEMHPEVHVIGIGDFKETWQRQKFVMKDGSILYGAPWRIAKDGRDGSDADIGPVREEVEAVRENLGEVIRDMVKKKTFDLENQELKRQIAVLSITPENIQSVVSSETTNYFLTHKNELKGDTGESSYTHVAYAESADGKKGFSRINSSGKSYIGFAITSTASSPPYTKFTWSKFKGENGNDADVGPLRAEFKSFKEQTDKSISQKVSQTIYDKDKRVLAQVQSEIRQTATQALIKAKNIILDGDTRVTRGFKLSADHIESWCIKIGKYGRLEPAGDTLQINVPKTPEANSGIGFQINGGSKKWNNQNEYIPSGVYIYKVNDFNSEELPIDSNENLLTVRGYIKIKGIDYMDYRRGTLDGYDTAGWGNYNDKNISLFFGKSDIWYSWNNNYYSIWNVIKGESSDRGLKKNIIDAGKCALDIIKKFKFKEFDWKVPDKFGKHTNIGLVAQDVEEVDETLVWMNGDILSLDTLRLTNLALKAVKELEGKVADLERRLENAENHKS